MPDISKCDNKECPIRHSCYRYVVKPDRYQSYGDFQHEIKDGDTYCEYYWKIELKEKDNE